jgi:hypothetical protein
VFLFNSNGYLSAQAVNPKTERFPRDWERWRVQVLDASTAKVAIFSMFRGLYLSATQFGALPSTVEYRPDVGAWETFTLEVAEDGQLRFRTQLGKYLVSTSLGFIQVDSAGDPGWTAWHAATPGAPEAIGVSGVQTIITWVVGIVTSVFKGIGGLVAALGQELASIVINQAQAAEQAAGLVSYQAQFAALCPSCPGSLPDGLLFGRMAISKNPALFERATATGRKLQFLPVTLGSILRNIRWSRLAAFFRGTGGRALAAADALELEDLAPLLARRSSTSSTSTLVTRVKSANLRIADEFGAVRAGVQLVGSSLLPAGVYVLAVIVATTSSNGEHTGFSRALHQAQHEHGGGGGGLKSIVARFLLLHPTWQDRTPFVCYNEHGVANNGHVAS